MKPTFLDIFDLKFQGVVRWLELEVFPIICVGENCYWHFLTNNLVKSCAEILNQSGYFRAIVRSVPVLLFEDELGEKFGVILFQEPLRLGQISTLETSLDMSTLSAVKVIRRRDQFLVRMGGFPRLETLFSKKENKVTFHSELLEHEETHAETSKAPETHRKLPGPAKGKQMTLHRVGQFGTFRKGQF